MFSTFLERTYDLIKKLKKEPKKDDEKSIEY